MKNWNGHIKLHAILKHQQKIQAEIDEKQNPGTSAPSISQLRDKMYRPTKNTLDMENQKDGGDEKTGTGGTTSLSLSPRHEKKQSNAVTTSAGSTAIFSTPPGTRPSGKTHGISLSLAYPGRLSRITIFLRSKLHQWSNGPRRYVALIVALVLVMVFMQLHIWGTYGAGEEPSGSVPEKEVDAQERGRIVTDEGSETEGATMESLLREIRELKEKVRQHEQQLKYILPRFVEQIPQNTDGAGGKIIDTKDLPQDLVAEPDKKASIKAKGENIIGKQKTFERGQQLEAQDSQLHEDVRNALLSAKSESAPVEKERHNEIFKKSKRVLESEVGAVAKESAGAERAAEVEQGSSEQHV